MPAAAHTASMAVEHDTELASMVAAYLRKHGFVKTLSAFFRETGDAFQEADVVVDLETLYKIHTSTQANGASKAKEPKKTKCGIEPAILEGDKDVRNGEEIVSASLHTKGRLSSEKKKKKKDDKKNASVDPPDLDLQTDKNATEATENIEEEGSKKKKKGKDTKIGGLKLDSEKALSDGNGAQCDSILKEDHEDGGCLATQQESAHSQKSSANKKKKEKKQQGVVLQDNETLVSNETRAADNAQVLPLDGDMPKKKRKKSKHAGGKEDAEDVKSASEVPISEPTEKLDAPKRPVDASIQSVESLGGGEISAKKRKHRKEPSSLGAEDGAKNPSGPKPEESKNDDTGNTKHSGKKRKVKEDADAGINSKQDFTNLGGSPEKLKEVEGNGGEDEEMHESGSVKAKKKEETPNNKNTPTGALAFKRVEVEKVTFSDPRLSDNSYWAKDGADEGYGAKAQEVLGLVRGRDFRHEKTKKKRGSYRGGIIGLESHSIKFDNSDED